MDTIGSWRWNCAGAMEAFGNLFDEGTEPGPYGEGLFADLLDGLRDDPEGPQVDLRRELFERSGPRICAYGRIGDPRTNERQLLFWAECADVKRVQESLKRFYQHDKDVKSETIAEHACWSIGPGKSLFVDVESDDLVELRGVAVGPHGFFAAADPELLRTVLAGERRPDAATGELWRRLLTEAIGPPEPASSGRLVAITAARFAPAYPIAVSRSDDFSSWEPALLRWLLLGDDYRGQRLKSTELPGYDVVKGLLLPLGLNFRRERDSLKLEIRFLDPQARPATK
jgi:hypothetical protein